MFYGFYSAMAAKRYGKSIYLNKEGKEVEVTEVCISNYPGSIWPDLVYVGQVEKYVRSIKGEEPNLTYNYEYDWDGEKYVVKEWLEYEE